VRGVQVREVRPDEATELGRITFEAYDALGGHLDDEYAHELRDVGGRSQVATVFAAVDPEGRVLGGVTYVDDPSNPYAEFSGRDEAGFRMLAVAPEAQGRGVGEALAAACIDLARAAGKRRLVLHSTPWMPAAHRLYRRLGFRRATELDWVPVPEVPLWGFVLDLVP
jgi:GNAT superfamily N-acetyltransferase